MDENIILTPEEVNEYVVDDSIIVENEEPPIDTEVVIESAEVEVDDEIEIEIEETIGWAGGDSTRHYSLNGRDEPNQHPIGAITGLRAELNEIERIKTVYADKVNVANYYEWENAAYDEYGYFVSLVPSTSKIKICNGSDILGVSIEAAGFVGGQDANIPRGNNYGLIATSGLVDVRCELEVKVGDYVVSNTFGYAKKADSNYGYRVLALEVKNGVTYAVIALGVQADVTNALGVHLNEVKEQVDANYKNIISAINIANQAYDKAGQVETLNREMAGKVDDALVDVGKMSTTVENMSAQVQQAQTISAQAKAIAEGAVTSAASMKQEAIDSANNAATQVGELTKTLEPLTTWTDPETGNTGASYLANYINNGLATKAEIETVEEDLGHSKSAILQNAKSLQSLVVSIDKYSVGEYSTAHGLTLDQATSILEPGIIYAPITSHKEIYSYVDGETTYEYDREFTPGYLYQWGQLSNGRYGWITIDKFYNEIADINVSAPSVYFSAYEIAITTGDDYGYWYTSAKTIYDTDGNITEKYEPYTLYKWDVDRWIAVATVAGNVNNRAISQIRQTANEISIEVTNARGSATTLGARIDDTESEVQSLALWSKGGDEDGEQYNLASVVQKADDASASVAQIVEAVGSDGKVSAASIVTAVNSQTGDSFVAIEGKYVNLKGQVTFESFDSDTKRKIEADSIDVQIWSSRGNIFKSGDTSTVLTCHVFSAGVDITSTLLPEAFTWEKVNDDGSKDETWRANPYGNHGNAIQITPSEIWSRAIFNCKVEI